jgi:double-stranded uracil-DNA glycosylase
MSLHRPTKAELQAARGRRLPDRIRPNLQVLFCGINPGLYSAALGCHFARPGNRFWKALYASGFTQSVLAPDESHLLLAAGYGLTDIVARATARADELGVDELIRGARLLRRKVRRHRPRWVAFLGITAYRRAFTRPRADLGPQREDLGGARIWVLPNPSGLNAHHPPAALARAMRALRQMAGPGPGS